MNEELASTSKNLDQDTEQMRSEGKGRGFGIGKMAVCVCVCVCLSVCVVRLWLRGMGNMKDVRLGPVSLLAV